MHLAIRIIHLLFILLFVSGCLLKPNEQEKEVLPSLKDSASGYNYIILSSGFNNDSLELYIDETKVYDGLPETAPTVEIAAEIPYQRGEIGSHQIRIQVWKDGKMFSKETIEDTINTSTIINFIDTAFQINSYKHQVKFR